MNHFRPGTLLPLLALLALGLASPEAHSSGGHGVAVADGHAPAGHGAADVVDAHAAEGEEHGEEEEEHHHVSQADVGIAGTLFGCVAFVMVIFYLVNWLDDDIRRYSWSIISTTLTIFISLLIFKGIDEIVRAVVKVRALLVLTEYSLFVALFIILQLVCAFMSGVCCEPEHVDLDEEVWTIADGLRADFGQQIPEYEVRNRSGVKSIAYIDKLEVFVQKKKFALETRERRMKCWAILIAHMTGFAGILAGTSLQRAAFFRQSPFTAFLVVLINQALFWMLFRFADFVRSRVVRKPSHHHDHRHEIFHEEVHESESDISALSISFLTVQAVRFAITGVLPNSEGDEVPEVPRSTGCIVALYVVGVGFAAGASLLLCLGRHMRSKTGLGAFLTLCQNTWAMSFAWSLLFATRWLALGNPTYQSIVQDAQILGRLILALVLSLGALVFIFVLDKIDDADIGGSNMGRIVQNFINALSILVGFSWEHCFEGGMEVLSSVGGVDPFRIKVFFTIAAVIVIIPAWRRYILGRVITLKQMHTERRKALGESLTSCEEESERSDGEAVC